MKDLLKVFVFFIILVFCFSGVYAANVGVSPASIYFPDVLRGGYAERSVTVSADSIEPIGIQISTWGEAKDWINYSEDFFELVKDSPHQLNIFVTPPDDIPNGNYTGFVRIMTSSLGESIEGHAVGVVRSSLDLAITIEIVDSEIIQCKTSHFEVNSVEKGDDIVFIMDILNEGNIRINPRIVVDIWNSDQTEIIHHVDFSDQQVLPTREDKFLVRVPSGGFDVSQYWAEVSVLDCFSSALLTFDVLGVGALSANGVLLRILSVPNASIGDTVLIEASFKNTGEKEVEAQFKGRITKNGKLVQILESPTSDVLINDIEKFPFYFTPQESGRYVIDGRVYYDSKKTFEKSAVIEIMDYGKGYPYLLIIVYIILAVLIIYLIYKVRKERIKYRRLRKL